MAVTMEPPLPNFLAMVPMFAQTMGVIMPGVLGVTTSATGVGVDVIIGIAKNLVIWLRIGFLLQLPASDCESAYPIASFHMPI